MFNRSSIFLPDCEDWFLPKFMPTFIEWIYSYKNTISLSKKHVLGSIHVFLSRITYLLPLLLFSKSIYRFLKKKFWKFCLDFVQAVSILGVTKLSGRCRRPISYSELLRNNRPTPDSETCNVCGLANVFFIRLIFGLKPSRKFWKIQ